MANPNGENPIMSPMINDELREQTLEILKRRNIYGVTSGNRLDECIEHGGDHIITSWMPPGHIDNWPPPAEVRKMLETGKYSVFGEVTLAYQGITAIETATFLTEEQKRDILYNNAARFLRLSQEEIDRHHGM